MKKFPNLRIALRVFAVIVIAWAAWHPAADVNASKGSAGDLGTAVAQK